MQRDQIFKFDKFQILEVLIRRHYIVIENRCDANMEEIIKRINVLVRFSLIIIFPIKTCEKHGEL